MAGDGVFKWFYAYSEDAETWMGRCDTRDDAIAQGKAEYDDDFWITEADSAKVSFDIFDTDRILEDYEEANIECWGEDGPDISPSKDQRRELEALLSAAFKGWAERHNLKGHIWSFGNVRNVEKITNSRPNSGAE